MKLLLGFLLLSLPVFASMTDQTTIDRYVTAAFSVSVERLQQIRGPFRCRFVEIHHFEGRGQNLLEAQTVAQLQCIRHECERAPERQADASRALNAQSDEELGYLLESLGHSPDQQATLIQRIRQGATVNGVFTCENDPRERMLAFDSCFSVPLECSR